MDNTGVIGHDLLADPARKFMAETTLASEEMVVAGPLTLQQCHGCDPIVGKAFVARLPIPSLTTEEELEELLRNETASGGRHQRKWGFAAALINWEALMEKIRIYETLLGT